MNSTEFIETPQWSLSPWLGYEHPFLSVNSEIIIHTWIIMFLLGLALTIINCVLTKTKIGRFIVLHGVAFFIDLTTQSLGHFVFNHCVFAASLFFFIALCNIASIIPWLDEPTRDINTALSVGIISFLYVQIYSIKTQGLGKYIGALFKPFFIMFPLNVIGKLSSIISSSFRLFGNIFGGSIITKLYFTAIQTSLLTQLFGIFSGFNILIVLFFTLFEGLLQAFVFAMLTLTFLSLGASDESSH